jgi:hypothetical protein
MRELHGRFVARSTDDRAQLCRRAFASFPAGGLCATTTDERNLMDRRAPLPAQRARASLGNAAMAAPASTARAAGRLPACAHMKI